MTSRSILRAALLAGLLAVLLTGCATKTTKPESNEDAGGAGGSTTQTTTTDSAPAEEEMQGEGFGEGSLTAEDQIGRIEGGSEPIDSEYPLDPVYFDYDSSALADTTLATLEEHARWILAHPRAHVVVEGHCDERGTIEYNLNLGARSAREVRDHLVRLGVPEDRIETITYGEERPAVPGSTPEAWAKNRRAEFRVEVR